MVIHHGPCPVAAASTDLAAPASSHAAPFTSFCLPLPRSLPLQHIPEDMSFTPEDGSFNSPETGTRIAAGDAVRVKIVGSTVMRSTLTAIGSIKEPYLGLLA